MFDEHSDVDRLESELQHMRSELEKISAVLTAERVKGKTEAPIEIYENLSSGIEEISMLIHDVRSSGNPKSHEIKRSLESKMNAFRSQWVRDIQFLKSRLEKPA